VQPGSRTPEAPFGSDGNKPLKLADIGHSFLRSVVMLHARFCDMIFRSYRKKIRIGPIKRKRAQLDGYDGDRRYAVSDSLSLTERLAAFAHDTGYDRLPPDVVTATKRRILDTVGVAWAGSTAPGCEAALGTVLAEGANGTSTIWASGDRAGCRGAAFVNGMHAAALDFDSVYERGSVHPDIVTIPAAWAVAEQVGADGRDFIAAVAVGNEIACRLGAANLHNAGWFYTSVHGVFGAAAAAAKLLGLGQDGIADALGLALSRAGGTQQALLEKSLAKRAQSGFAAEAGVFAAQLAAAGISGPREAIEGKFGFHALYGEGNRDVLIDGLGLHYEQAATAIKKYPSCTANHVPIDLLIQIAETHDLRPDDVEAVEVRLSPFANQLVGGAFDPSTNPQVAAQFSIQYSAASALLRRRLGIGEIQDDAVSDPRIARFIPKVAVTVDEANRGKFAPAGVCVRMSGGAAFDGRLDHVPGTQGNPLSDSEVAAKFRDCVKFGSRPLGSRAADRLAMALGGLGGGSNLRTLFDGIHDRSK
jgi:2-methylcitrate dehydratase PrpD